MRIKRVGGILAGVFALAVGLVLALGIVGVSAASAQATDSAVVATVQAVETAAEPITVVVPAPKIGEAPATMSAVSLKGKEDAKEAAKEDDAILGETVEVADDADGADAAENATEDAAEAGNAVENTAAAQSPVKITSVDWKDDKGKAFAGKFELNKRYSVVVGLSTDEAHPFDAKTTKVVIAGNKAELSKVTKTSLVATYKYARLQDPATAVYKVRVVNDGHGEAVAEPASGKTGEKVMLVATPNEGYEFDKWELVAAEGGKLEGDEVTIGTDNVKVKAIFKKVELDSLNDTTTPETPIDGDIQDGTLYTVKVTEPVYGEVTVEPKSDNGYMAGESVTLTAIPYDDYAFDTWKVVSGSLPSAGLDLTKATLEFTMPASNLEFEAEFKEASAAVYNVTVTNDGNGSATADVASGTTGTEVTLTATPNDGFEFDKWEVVSGGVDIVGDKFTIGNGDVEVRATFKEKGSTPTGQYTITFDPNGGEGTMDPQSFNAGESATLNENKFTREGYTFGGWNTKADGSGTKVKDKAKVRLSSNVTLYAQWTQGSGGSGSGGSSSTYTISFNGNGGSGSMPSISVNPGESAVLSANEFTRSGYEFNGWNTRANGTGTAYGDQATVTPNGSMTLYAQWRSTSSSSSRSTNSNSSNSTTSSGSLGKTADTTTAAPIVLAVVALSVFAGARASRKNN